MTDLNLPVFTCLCFTFATLPTSMQSPEQTSYFSTSNTDAFFRKRYSTTWVLALGLLLFLLPFSQVKCASATLAENSGLGIALGWQWKIVMAGSSNELLKKITKDEPGRKNDLKEKPNIFAIVALIAGLIGIVVSLLTYNHRSLIVFSAGALGVVMLIALLIQFKMVLQSALSAKGGKEMDMSSIITVQFTFWYFLSLFLFAAAAFIGFKQYKIELQDALKRAYDFEFERHQRIPGLYRSDV
jgi:uncharacterized membrane protein